MTTETQTPAAPAAPQSINLDENEILTLQLKGSTVGLIARAVDELPLTRKARDEFMNEFGKAVIAAKAPKNDQPA